MMGVYTPELDEIMGLYGPELNRRLSALSATATEIQSRAERAAQLGYMSNNGALGQGLLGSVLGSNLGIQKAYGVSSTHRVQYCVSPSASAQGEASDVRTKEAYKRKKRYSAPGRISTYNHKVEVGIEGEHF